ncbi:Hypothetical protein P9303_16521 [Prochlorococcus marinus str. MIT 9303]|uniref:Uncharacterized protein n=1 Tax=Prochlorococcus marinus (strain MIT 9303) TaxID=59922 RepID=A2CA86_PROM3|nr:Hypothetical protein P9303_16521 [Prochlorococcus marinus str. MIT 9303]
MGLQMISNPPMQVVGEGGGAESWNDATPIKSRFHDPQRSNDLSTSFLHTASESIKIAGLGRFRPCFNWW